MMLARLTLAAVLALAGQPAGATESWNSTCLTDLRLRHLPLHPPLPSHHR